MSANAKSSTSAEPIEDTDVLLIISLHPSANLETTILSDAIYSFIYEYLLFVSS